MATDTRPVAGPGAPRELRAALAAEPPRERAMAERLRLALSWNSVAAELRAGLAAEPPRKR